MTPMIRLLNLSFDELEKWYQITRNLEANERDTTQLYEDTVAKYMQISKVSPQVKEKSTEVHEILGDAASKGAFGLHEKLYGQNPFMERFEILSLLLEMKETLGEKIEEVKLEIMDYQWVCLFKICNNTQP